MKKRLHEESGLLIKNLTADSKSGLSFEVITQEGVKMFGKVTQIYEQKCKISFHGFLNQSKGIIYIQKSEFSDELKKNLLEAYPEIQEAEVATFIKFWNEGTTAILLTFPIHYTS